MMSHKSERIINHNEKDNISVTGNNSLCPCFGSPSAKAWLPRISGVEQQCAFR